MRLDGKNVSLYTDVCVYVCVSHQEPKGGSTPGTRGKLERHLVASARAIGFPAFAGRETRRELLSFGLQLCHDMLHRRLSCDTDSKLLQLETHFRPEGLTACLDTEVADTSACFHWASVVAAANHTHVDSESRERVLRCRDTGDR